MTSLKIQFDHVTTIRLRQQVAQFIEHLNTDEDAVQFYATAFVFELLNALDLPQNHEARDALGIPAQIHEE